MTKKPAILLLLSILLVSHAIQAQNWNLASDNYTTGRLSIGTSTFSDKLSIEGSGQWQVRLKDNVNGADWRIGSSGSDWVAGGGKFLISNNAGSNNASLVIDTQRKVGIGTYNPQGYLDVGASLQGGLLGSVLGRLPEGGTTGSGTYLGVRGFASQQDEYQGKSFALEHSFYGSVNSSINFYRGGGINGGFVTFTTNDNTEKMRLTHEGKLAIGTTDPRDFKLAVAGKAVAEEVVVQLKANWPDYVFENEYKLPSLSELEKFIVNQKHLPGVPTAEEVGQNGLSLGEMNAILLKKVEELTLYVIQQDKAMCDQAKKMKSLEDRVNKLELRSSSSISRN